MTIEKTIKALEDMKELQCFLEIAQGYEIDALDLAIAALRAQQERENPKPLTLLELLAMDGEPVWVESPGMRKYGRWAIVDSVDIERKVLWLRADYTCHDYGKVWLAYRHKPKEG